MTGFLRTLFGPKPPLSGSFSVGVMACAESCGDALLLHHGCDWQQIDLTFERIGGRLAVTSSEVKGPNATRSSALLALDPLLQTAEISAAFGALEAALAADRRPWEGVGASCTQDAAGITIALLGKRGITHSLPTVLASWLSFGPAFFDELARIEAAVIPRQRQLEPSLVGITSRRWDRIEDPGHLLLTYADGRTRRYACDVIGSYSRGAGSWCWAFANSSFAPALAAATKVLAATAPPLRLFDKGGFACQEALASTVATLAAHRMQGRAVFPSPIEGKGVTLYFAVDPTQP